MTDDERYVPIGMVSGAGGERASGAEETSSGARRETASDAGEDRAHANLSLDFELLLAASEARNAAALTVEELLGRAILRARLYFGWSQQELGRRSRLSQSTISRLERGVQRGLSIRRLYSVLRALRIAEVDLIPRKPAAPPTPLELMLYGDQWAKAVAAADERLSRRRSA
jgi:transcriptional regulator with XRE-family HTH domain